MAVAGPVAEILFAEFRDQLRFEPERARCLDRAPRRAGIAGGILRQTAPQRIQPCAIAKVGRRVGGVDRSFDAVDRRVPDQPEQGLAFHVQTLQGSWSLWQ